jgi:hypothetical protein
MLYSTSRDALRRALDGVQVDVQATEFDEVSQQSGALLLFLYSFLLAQELTFVLVQSEREVRPPLECLCLARLARCHSIDTLPVPALSLDLYLCCLSI